MNSYPDIILVAGKGHEDYQEIKGVKKDFSDKQVLIELESMMYNDKTAWHKLMTKLADVAGDYLLAQAKAGAQALQLFDSWVGELSPQDYRQYVQPYSKHTLDIAKDAGVLKKGTAKTEMSTITVGAGHIHEFSSSATITPVQHVFAPQCFLFWP